MMKTRQWLRSACYLSASAALIGAPGAEIAEASSATVAADKTHSLFMGADISVEVNKTFHRVKDVSRSSWVVTVDGRPEFIPTVQRALNLRVEQSLKLSHRTASVIDFKAERAYTPGNNPKQQALTHQIQMSALTTEQAMVAERELSRSVEALSRPTDYALPPRDNPFDARGPQATGGMERVDSALADLQRTNSIASGPLTGNSFHDGIAEEQLKQENFDAIAVEFDLTSEKPLQNPYLVIVVQFREKTEAPKMARNWIYAESLDPIDEKPQKIRLLRGGFPWGYTLDKVEVHLYNEGAEVATNVSPKRVPLTAEEAFQYLVIEHIGENKGKTVNPVPAMAQLPAELKTRLAAGEGQQVYYLKVSKEGNVVAAYEDETYSREVKDPFFAKALKGIWFKPGLVSGKPVEATAKVDVTKL